MRCLSVHSIHGPGSASSILPHHLEEDTVAGQPWDTGCSYVVLPVGVRAMLSFSSFR